MGWLSNFRYRTAFSFGRIEHTTSRILFVSLLITYGVLLLVKFKNIEIKYAEWMTLLNIVLWIIYWLAHTLEKAFHPNH